MSKNSIEKSSFRRYSPNARISGPRKNFLDRFAGWLGSRSRLVRSVIAAIIAIILTGALVLVSYGLLLSLSSRELAKLLSDHPETLSIILVALVVIGMGLYWVGWRVLIGFDRGETALEPGRSAAIWVIFGLLTLAMIIIFTVITVADALST